MKTRLNQYISIILGFVFLLMNMPMGVLASQGAELATDGTKTVLEAEDLSIAGVTKMTSVSSGTYSGTGYVFAMNSVSGPSAKIIEIPVSVSQGGTYSVNVHGLAYATKSDFVDSGSFHISAGETSVELTRGAEILFGALRNGTTYNVYSYTGDVELDIETTSVELRYEFTGSDKYKLVLDSIEFTLKNEEPEPTEIPTEEPTPTPLPTDTPTAKPTETPTNMPSTQPTSEPTDPPSPTGEVTVTVEAETLSYTANDGNGTNMIKGISKAVNSGTYSGTGYVYAYRNRSGTWTFEMTIPVTVTKAGIYRFDVDGYTNAPFQIAAGGSTIELSNTGTVKFVTGAIDANGNVNNKSVTTWTNEIYLDPDMTTITLKNTAVSRLDNAVDCIRYTLIKEAINADGTVTRIEAENLGLGRAQTVVTSGEYSGEAYISNTSDDNYVRIPITVGKDGLYEISFAAHFPDEIWISCNDYYKQQLSQENNSIFTTVLNNQTFNACTNKSVLYLTKETSEILLSMKAGKGYLIDYIEFKYIDESKQDLILKDVLFEKYDGNTDNDKASSATDKIYLSFNNQIDVNVLAEYLTIATKDGKKVDTSIEYKNGRYEVTLNKMLDPNTVYDLKIDEALCKSELYERQFMISKRFKTEDDGMFFVNNLLIKNNSEELQMNGLSENDQLTLYLEIIKTTDDAQKYTLLYFLYNENEEEKNIMKYLPITIESESKGRIIYTMDVNATDIDNIARIKGLLWSYPNNVSIARCEYEKE